MVDNFANALRPQKLSDIIGQRHLVGEGSILYNLLKNKKMVPIILYGKPGTGKTSLANVIVNELEIKSRFLNAVINNKKDFDIVVEEAKMHGTIIVVMDEIHRLNKDKQDLLLPQIESGRIILIGMTTANPYHSINPAIRSRCHLFELKELDYEDVLTGLNNVIKQFNDISINQDAIEYIAHLSNGDLRYAYNFLELAYYGNNKNNISLDYLKTINNNPVFSADKNGDDYYDVLSGFQKSIRGSDVHASLHYLARLITIGDLDSIFRRMTVIAYEDIGLANPSMGPKVMACINACERLGIDEGRIALSACVIELALSPKSNSAYLAIDKALNDIKLGNVGSLPKHLKTHSQDYKYPHNYPNYYVKQQYLPDKLKDRKYYHPKKNKYEEILNDILKKMEG